MDKKTDIEIVRDAIELFMVNHFDTIEMSGSVKFKIKKYINYISIDLNSIEWDDDLNKLHQSLVKYLKDWGEKNRANFSDYISVSRLTIEYLLPIKDGANQNQSKHLKLFLLPSYYYQTNKSNDGKVHTGLKLKFLIFWHNIILRNIIITIIPTIIFIGISACKLNTDINFSDRLLKSYDYINIASGIIASFVLGFLITKVITIRQDKLKYAGAVKDLSNKLTYFRNICFNLTRDHRFWSKEKPFYESYTYANSIKNDITYEEYHYPNYDDDIEYAKFKSFYNEKVSHSVVVLVLQLHMMADEDFLNSGLTYTDFPPNYIYSHSEMQKYLIVHDSNQIWYCCSEIKIFPENFYTSHHVNEIIKDINRIYPENSIENLSRKKLEDVSLDFQYRIIPTLFKLTRIVDSDLPLTISYFITTFILLLSFGLIIPTLTYVFIDKSFALLSVFVVIGIIGHILLTLKPILRDEITLDEKYDYL